MVDSFIYCCRYPDQGPPWSSQLGSIPCLAGLSRDGKFVGHQPRVEMHHSEGASVAIIMFPVSCSF
jgi:hypothetical protein